jgi:hypothetical protein
MRWIFVACTMQNMFWRLWVIFRFSIFILNVWKSWMWVLVFICRSSSFLGFRSYTCADVRSWYCFLRMLLFCFWCFGVEFLLACLMFSCCFGITVQCLIVLSFRWLAVIFVVGCLGCVLNVSKLRLWWWFGTDLLVLPAELVHVYRYVLVFSNV